MELTDNLQQAYETRKSQFSCVSFRYAVVRQPDPRFLRGVVRFEPTLRKADTPLDYGRLLLGETIVDPLHAFAMIAMMLGESSVMGLDASYPGKYEFRMHDAHRKSLPVHSYDRFLGNEWPSTVAYVTSASQRVTEPEGPLVSLDLPLYTDARRAIKDWLRMDALGVSELSNGVVVFLPDFRLRIKQTLFSESSAVVELEGEKKFLSKATVKAGLGYGNDYVIPNIERADGKINVDLPRGIPSTFDLFVLESSTGEVLDWQEIYTSWTEFPSNVEFSVPGQQVKHLVDGGETDTVEFKVSVGDGAEFIESVIAFANTGDGVILVGVDDNAVFVGLPNPDREQQRIIDMVNDTIEPIPRFQPSRVTVEGKEIVVVNVNKGENPPYLHKTRHVGFVRRAGTDRLMGRVEFDEIYAGSASLGRRIR